MSVDRSSRTHGPDPRDVGRTRVILKDEGVQGAGVRCAGGCGNGAGHGGPPRWVSGSSVAMVAHSAAGFRVTRMNMHAIRPPAMLATPAKNKASQAAVGMFATRGACALAMKANRTRTYALGVVADGVHPGRLNRVSRSSSQRLKPSKSSLAPAPSAARHGHSASGTLPCVCGREGRPGGLPAPPRTCPTSRRPRRHRRPASASGTPLPVQAP